MLAQSATLACSTACAFTMHSMYLHACVAMLSMIRGGWSFAVWLLLCVCVCACQCVCMCVRDGSFVYAWRAAWLPTELLLAPASTALAMPSVDSYMFGSFIVELIIGNMPYHLIGGADDISLFRKTNQNTGPLEAGTVAIVPYVLS